MASKITYWKIANPLPFEGKSGLIDAVRILCINNLNLTDAVVLYEIGWVIIVNGVVTEFKAMSEQLSWRWADASYVAEGAKFPLNGLTRQQDLLKLFYDALIASHPEYTGQLVVQDTV